MTVMEMGKTVLEMGEAKGMTTENQPTANYTMGYSEEFLQLLERRNAGNSAAYLLPLLEPGMKLLDLGCGPGTITMGLAETVSPGEVHGIDMEESQIALAQAAAEGLVLGSYRDTRYKTEADATGKGASGDSGDSPPACVVLQTGGTPTDAIGDAVRRGAALRSRRGRCGPGASAHAST